MTELSVLVEQPRYVDACRDYVIKNGASDPQLAIARYLCGQADWGLSKKSDGHRVIVEFDGQEMRAYNRALQPMTVSDKNPDPILPKPALALKQLGKPFVLDGEAIGGRGHWSQYFVFNVLEWDRQRLDNVPYRRRLSMLVRMADYLGVPFTPDPVVGGLPLQFVGAELDPARKLALLDEFRQRVPVEEGVIFRQMDASLTHGKTTTVLKYPFITELDCFGYYWNPPGKGTLKGGSVAAAVYWKDQQVHIANIRSGFSHTQLDEMEAALKMGQRPVLKVGFLGKRTVGIDLVQPRCLEIRDDKQAEACGGDQLVSLLGQDRAALFDQRVPLTLF